MRYHSWLRRGSSTSGLHPFSALTVRPDVGLKCFGHPIGASGLRTLYEMCRQLQGEAGPRQIKDPKLGLTYNLGGPPTSPTIGCVIVGL